MKRYISLLLIVSIFLIPSLFTACSHETHSNVKANISSNNLKLYSSYGGVGIGNEKGFYYCKIDENALHNIMYIDYNTSSELYLCNRAECDHKTDSCTSVIIPYGGAINLIPSHEKLFIFYTGSGGEADFISKFGSDALPRVEVMDINGENRRILFKLEANEQMYGKCVFSENEIFIVVSAIENTNGKPENKFYLCRYDILTGVELSRSHIDLISPSIVACGDNVLYFESLDLNDDHQVLTSAEKAIWKYYIESGNSTKLFSKNISQYSVAFNNETAYILDRESAMLTSIDLSNNKESILCDKIVHNAKVGGITTLTDNGVVYFYYENGNYDNVKKSFFNFDSNLPVEINIPVNIYGNTFKQAPDILAETDDLYLISTGVSSTPVGFYNYDGTIVKFHGDSHRMAIISKQNYLNNISNYNLITTIN